MEYIGCLALGIVFGFLLGTCTDGTNLFDYLLEKKQLEIKEHELTVQYLKSRGE